MDDASLNDCLWENGINGLGIPSNVNHGDENVLAPLVFSSFSTRSQNLAPSVCSIQLPSPWCHPAEHPARVDRLIALAAFVADLVPNGIAVLQRVTDIAVPVLPFCNLSLLLSKRTRQVFETEAGTAWNPSNGPA